VIASILPAAVSAFEAGEELDDAVLFPAEEALIARAVPKRRGEFSGGRGCAREALAGLGIAPGPIVAGERGEPAWPAGVVGSITHCDGYRACAVARAREVVTLGIDAEPHAPIAAELLPDIARPEEIPALRRLAVAHADVHWDRLLFSAKESVYKAWFPLARRWLGFEDATVEFDPSQGRFTATLLVPGPLVAGTELRSFSGRWTVAEGIVATAIVMARDEVAPPLETPASGDGTVSAR
jgi:4'-phosphopantetheinyl transferase EntD